MSCAQDDTAVENSKVEEAAETMKTRKEVPHNYGGYYCPDNLGGFPAVDISNWESVPVINGRMATKEETQNGTSLIFVDDEKYPDAKPLDIKMPKLARYYNRSSGKKEIIIVIQALNISNDSIVGFRYLNGGNGSARLNEVKLLSDSEIENISSSRFVSLDIEINATQDEIWEVLTKSEYTKTLRAIFDKENRLTPPWDNGARVNYAYANSGPVTSEFAGNLFGNQYIQVDCEAGDYQYVSKFLLLENKQTKKTEFHIVCGPYGDDFKSQKTILKDWAKKVKELSEKNND
jgi:hypothetical protein